MNPVVNQNVVGRISASRLPEAGYLPLTEAAVYSGVSVRTVRRWIQQGLPVYRSGPRSKVLVRPAEIDQFLTRQQMPHQDLNALIEDTMTDFLTRRTV